MPSQSSSANPITTPTPTAAVISTAMRKPTAAPVPDTARALGRCLARCRSCAAASRVSKFSLGLGSTIGERTGKHRAQELYLGLTVRDDPPREQSPQCRARWTIGGEAGKGQCTEWLIAPTCHRNFGVCLAWKSKAPLRKPRSICQLESGRAYFSSSGALSTMVGQLASARWMLPGMSLTQRL